MNDSLRVLASSDAEPGEAHGTVMGLNPMSASRIKSAVVDTNPLCNIWNKQSLYLKSLCVWVCQLQLSSVFRSCQEFFNSFLQTQTCTYAHADSHA